MSSLIEVVILELKDQSETLEGSGSAATTWKEALDNLLAPEGARRVYWGKVVENPSWVRVFMEWDSHEHRHNFHPTASFAAFAEKSMTLFSEKILIAHTHLMTFHATAREALTAPVTELLSIFLPAEYTAEQVQTFEAGIRQFHENIVPEAKALRAAVGGWVTEDLPPGAAWPSTNRKTYLVCVGWNSAEDHISFSTTDVFKENVGLIVGADGFQDTINMHFHGHEVLGN